jgi:phosphoribosylaminoimidazolecarboxamide formyltransferase/IMP cyclohydrolase
MSEQVATVFTEVVVAPGFEPEALEILERKKAIRLLQLPEGMEHGGHQVDFRAVSGGILMQTRDNIDAVVGDGEVSAAGGSGSGGDEPSRWSLVCGEQADAATLADLAFAWRAIRAVKSNAILLAKAGASVGVGMGQVNRVDSCHLAVTRAGADRAAGSVAASDAFFPFADGLQVLLDAGVRAVVAPGGSIRDSEVIEAATAAGITMYFTGTRHFAH